MSVRVKICGIRRVEDALLASDAGADAIGLLVGQRHGSDDFISPDEAAQIVNRLPPWVSSTLVTHVEDPVEVSEIVRQTRVSAVQIHSDMSPEGVLVVRVNCPGVTIIKSYHVISQDSLMFGDEYTDVCDAFLLDSINNETGQVGGTGLTHDWLLSAQIVARYKLPVILAGGLNAGNVADAVRLVRPFGVDVNSGVKNSCGFKDPVKVAEFIKNAKSV